MWNVLGKEEMRTFSSRSAVSILPLLPPCGGGGTIWMEVSMEAVCPSSNRRTRLDVWVVLGVSPAVVVVVLLLEDTVGNAEASPAKSPAIITSMGDDDDDDDDDWDDDDDDDDGTVANASVQLLFGTLCTTVGCTATSPAAAPAPAPAAGAGAAAIIR